MVYNNKGIKMSVLEEISDKFKVGIKTYNELSKNPFNVSYLFSNKNLKNISKPLLLIAALSASFNVNANDQAGLPFNVQANSTELVEKRFSVDNLIKNYDIDVYKNNASIESLDDMDSIDFEDIDTGVY